MTHSSVHIQIAEASVPSWFGEVAIVAQLFTKSGLLKPIKEQVRFARPRCGTYEVIDFVVVLLGYTGSGEPPLRAFYDRLTPFASAFMALFDRQALPQRSVAFWQPWISQASRHGERSFKRIWSREPLRPFHQAGCGIVWATTGSSSMSMAPNKQPDNEPFRLLQSFLLPIGVLTRDVLPHIWGANEEKWHGPAPPCSTPTHTPGWAASVALGMEITVANGHAHVRPSSAMRAGSVCLCLTFGCAWMGCMGMQQS